MLDDKKATHQNILLQVGGSIAAFKAIALTSALVKAGYAVQVVLSEGASRFVGAPSFEGLTGNPVYTHSFEEGRMMSHIDLERWADLILLYPASASQLSSLASGSAHDLTTCLFLAHEFKKPYLIAPAMNQAMWKHPATLRNVNILKTYGVTLLAPASGSLACGEVGEGRLMEPEAVFSRIQEYFDIHQAASFEVRVPEAQKKRILVTAGGTTEPIDEVRQLRNMSTGNTGHALAGALQNSGYSVTLFQSETSSAREGIERVVLYSTTRDFAEKLKQELSMGSYDYVIHAAAVADYHVESITDGKGIAISGAGKIQLDSPLYLKLVPNPKIIREIRTWSKNKEMKLISFKLTTDDTSDFKLETYDSDFIIQNHLKDVGPDLHKGRIFERTPAGGYREAGKFQSKSELNLKVIALISDSKKETVL